jgi:SAM-dependent methyltransferase
LKSFDHVAKAYDEQFTDTKIGKAQRDLVWKYVRNQVNSAQKALELNCGTGRDAQFLAEHCNTVMATDLSPEMIDFAKTKYQKSNLSFQTLDINRVDQIDDKFDLIFSNFGGLNCLDPKEWIKLSSTLSNKLNPGGEIIAVIMSRNCAWERFYFKKQKDEVNRNRRRSKEVILANVDGVDVKTWYYSPDEIIGYMQPNFTFIGTKPIGLFIPPSYLEPYFRKKKVIFNVLKLMESFSVSSNKNSDKADHYLIHFKKGLR